MRSLISVAAVVALLAGLGPAHAATATGPAIGSRAPSLTVVDASATPRSLASLAGPRGTVLVFFRSAAWCPFCQRQLIALKAADAPLTTRGYRLAALSYDAPATLAGFAAKHGIAYPLLSDKSSVTIDAFGIRDPQYAADSPAHGVPLPAIFVLDARGVVRGKLAEDGYRSRPPVVELLALVDGLPAK